MSLLVVVVTFRSGLLASPPRGDEVHFWNTTLRFSHTLLPPLDLLRDYGELNTPLPFVLWGALEHLFGGGIQIARLTNLLAAAAVLYLVLVPGTDARHDPRPRWRTWFIAAALLAFPYYPYLSVLAYTDMIPTLLALLGFALHLRGRYLAAAVAFVLAVSGRQYMIAVPAALGAYELLRAYDRRRFEIGPFVAPAAAAAALLGWFLFFGGFGPQGEVEVQQIATTPLTSVLPRNSLYFLACIGAYWAIPSLVLRRPVWPPARADLRFALGVAAALAPLFVLFPPIRNHFFFTFELGALDRIVRLFTNDMTRMIVYHALAVLAIVRLRRHTLATLLLAANAVLMMKAHVAWDKYALPLLVVLWYLEARGMLGDETAAEPEAARGHPADRVVGAPA